MPALVLATLISLATPSTAFDRGEVLLVTRSLLNPDVPQPVLWDFRSGQAYALAMGWILTEKVPPFFGGGHFIAPAPGEIIFENDQTLSVWNGMAIPFTSADKGYTDVLHDDVELSEIAPMRSGHFVVAERSADRARGAHLIEFDLQGRIRDHLFPEVLDASGRALGARHIELLADQCTLLYTNGDDDPNGNRVRRMNICTETTEPDFAPLAAGQYAGAIRQMADGSVIVADGLAILRFSPNGSLIRSYAAAGVTHLALTTDGNAFWTAGVNDGAPDLRFFGNGDSIRIGNPEMQPAATADDISDLVVVGEFRAAMTRHRAAR